MRSRVFLALSVAFLSQTAFADEKGDPSDIWYRGFLILKSADQYIESGNRLAGLNRLDEAFGILKQLPLEHPEFQSDIVNERLRLIANQRFRLARVIKNEAPSRLEELEEELESLKKRLKELEGRREAVEKEMEELQRRERIPPPELPSFHEKTDEEEGLFNAPPLGRELFPDGRFEIEGDDGTTIFIEPESSTPNLVPDHWIPRPFEGEMFYLIPLK